jgi:hypothetical protein
MRSATKTAPLDATIETFFATKTAGDIASTMTFFSPDLVSYIDPTLGWEFDGYDVLKGVSEQDMPSCSGRLVRTRPACLPTSQALSSAPPIRRSSSAAS